MTTRFDFPAMSVISGNAQRPRPRGQTAASKLSRRLIVKAGCAMLAGRLRSWSAEPILGVILPRKGAVPAEALTMYPSGVRFVTEAFSTADDGRSPELSPRTRN